MPYDWLGISSAAISSGAISGAEAVRYVETVGTADGTSTATGIGASFYEANASASGTSVATGIGVGVNSSIGSASGSASVSGAGAVVLDIVGSAAGTSTVSGVSGVTAGIVGSAVGTCTVIAIGTNVGWTQQQNDDATWSDQVSPSTSWSMQSSSVSNWTEVPIEKPVAISDDISISSAAISAAPISGQNLTQENNSWIEQGTVSSSWIKKAA